MKRYITLILVFTSLIAFGQKTNQPTESISITGQVVKELKFTLDDIKEYPMVAMDDVIITNYRGQSHSVAKELKGVLVKDLLSDMQLKEEKQKLFSEFYLVFIAKDGYKVVYSWNEIFNSPIGDSLFLITSRDGKSIKDMEERILILTPIDFHTGRRHIKGLQEIVVERVN